MKKKSYPDHIRESMAIRLKDIKTEFTRRRIEIEGNNLTSHRGWVLTVNDLIMECGTEELPHYMYPFWSNDYDPLWELREEMRNELGHAFERIEELSKAGHAV